MAINILLADDLAFIRNVLRDTLASVGFNVLDEVGADEEPIELSSETRPNVVLMDITMSRMDGLDALRAIRTTNPNACIIMCTALGQGRPISEAIRSGVRDLMVKTFTPERVVAAVKTVLNLG